MQINFVVGDLYAYDRDILSRNFFLTYLYAFRVSFQIQIKCMQFDMLR